MIPSHSRIPRIALALWYSSLVGPGSAMQDVFDGDEAAPGSGLGSVIRLSWVEQRALICMGVGTVLVL